MRLLTVSSLSSWIHCPRQFFLQNVLEVKDPINSAMALGMVKHKLHELISLDEQSLVLSLKATDPVDDIFQTRFTSLVQQSVIKHLNVLRMVNVEPHFAFQSTLPLARNEALERAAIVKQALSRGLNGSELWAALTPKIKSEYSVESKKLGLKGRIDKLECYPDKIIPIELKSGSTPAEGVYDSHRIQAVSYALMLEEQFGSPVVEAIVHYVDTHQKRSIMINPFLKEWVIETKDKAAGCVSTREIPKGCGKDNCTACKRCDDLVFVETRLKELTLKR